MKLTELVKRIVANAAYLFLSDKATHLMICMWFHTMFALSIAAGRRYLNEDFPAGNIVEKETRGMLVEFTGAMFVKLIVDLDNTVTAQYQILLTTLDKIRKGQQ